MNAYSVTVRRVGATPHTVRLVVGARSADEAAGLATTLAERESGGMFEARRVRRARTWRGDLDAVAA